MNFSLFKCGIQEQSWGKDGEMVKRESGGKEMAGVRKEKQITEDGEMGEETGVENHCLLQQETIQNRIIFHRQH